MCSSDLTGYVKIFRSLKSHWLWSDSTKLKWWLDLILSANYLEQKVLIKNTLIVCKRGETIKSIRTWAKEWRTTDKTVKSFLDLLKNDNMIDYVSDKNTTHITICNYDSYNETVITTSARPPYKQ